MALYSGPLHTRRICVNLAAYNNVGPAIDMFCCVSNMPLFILTFVDGAVDEAHDKCNTR
jgi:hypothetical protein